MAGFLPTARRRLLAGVILLLIAGNVHAYRLIYREQLYGLYHQHFTMYPERIAENVYWLEQALRSDFANPLNALRRGLERAGVGVVPLPLHDARQSQTHRALSSVGRAVYEV
jgi:hypothetical protein